MARLSKEDRHRVAAAEDALATVRLDGPPAVERVTEVVASLLDVPHALVLGIGSDETRGLHVDEIAARAVDVSRVRELTDRSLSRHGTSWTGWNPRRPEPAQRNVGIDVVKLLGWERLETLPAYTDVVRAVGLPPHQTRILVCEDESLLAWVGGFSEEPFSDAARHRLQAVAPSLRRTLLAGRWLANAPVAFAALDVALEQIPSPAMIVRDPASVVYANVAARAWLAGDGRGARELLAARPADTFVETRLAERGVPGHSLLVLRSRRTDPEPRAAAWRVRYGLTASQARVLAHVARGASNKEIATVLAVVDATIEAHVTAIFAKTGTRSRAELVARFWSE